MIAVPGPTMISTVVPMNSAAAMRTSETPGAGGTAGSEVAMDAPNGEGRLSVRRTGSSRGLQSSPRPATRG